MYLPKKEAVNQIYYSHSKQILDFVQETEEIEFISSLYPSSNIINPVSEIEWKGSMTPYFEAIEKSDLFICSMFKDHCGKGVFTETNYALENKVPCFIIFESNLGCYDLYKVTDVEFVNPDEWSTYYGVIRFEFSRLNEETQEEEIINTKDWKELLKK